MVKKIILIVFSLLFLSGCVKGDVNIKYTNLEKANLIIELLCQKEILSTYDTTLEDIQNKLAVNQLKNWQIKELNESINGVSYVGFALNAPDNINNMLLNYISYDQENNTYQVLFPKDLIDSLLNSSELQDINNSSLLSLENMGLEINLKISLPGKITETNYGNINNNEVCCLFDPHWRQATNFCMSTAVMPISVSRTSIKSLTDTPVRLILLIFCISL